MASRFIVLLLPLLLIMGSADSACLAANPVKMRPYSGIGVIMLPGIVSGHAPQQPIYLYREPGLFRFGVVNKSKLVGTEWIFGSETVSVPLIVSARKGSWLQVCYDDAGREAWINPQRSDSFKSWDVFLKSRMSHVLPGLRKQYYQLYLKPDQNPIIALTPTQSFRVLKLENSWVMVLIEQATIGWLRWRDEDDRLTIGID